MRPHLNGTAAHTPAEYRAKQAEYLGSDNLTLQKSLLVGYRADGPQEEVPVVLHLGSLSNGPVALLGEPGTRKTSLMSRIAEWALRLGVTCIVLDLKGGASLLGLVNDVCRSNATTLRCVNNLPGHHTHIWNLFSQSDLSSTSALAVTESELRGLGLEHPSIYGASYFARTAREAYTALRLTNPHAESFEHLLELADQQGFKFNRDSEELQYVLQHLAREPLLNHRRRDGETVFQGGADIARCLEEGECLYFHLPVSHKSSSSKEIAMLVASTLMRVQSERLLAGTNKPVLLFVDEFAQVASSAASWRTLFTTARESGVGVLIAAQNPADLDAQAPGMWSTIQGTAGVIWNLGVSDRAIVEQLASISGFDDDPLRRSPFVTQLPPLIGETPKWPLPTRPSSLRTRYSPEELQALCAHEELSYLWVKKQAGLVRYPVPILVRSGFHVTEETYRRQCANYLPEPTDEMIRFEEVRFGQEQPAPAPSTARSRRSAKRAELAPMSRRRSRAQTAKQKDEQLLEKLLGED